MMGLSLKGIQSVIISKKVSIRWIEDIWFHIRKRVGTEIILAQEGGGFSILKTLKKNKLVVFPLDQFMPPPMGVPTDFFGYKTGTSKGLALIAQRSQAPVLPMYTFREPDDSTSIFIEPEIPSEKIKEEEQENILYMTQKYTFKIEEIIRKKPEQWLWTHRRWKPI